MSSSQPFEKVSVAESSGCHAVFFFFFFFQETYQNRVAFHNATYLAGAVSLYALSQSNKDTAVCLFLSDYL